MPRAPPYILHVSLSGAFTYQTVWRIAAEMSLLHNVPWCSIVVQKIRMHIVVDLCLMY